MIFSLGPSPRRPFPMEALDVLVLSAVFKTVVGREERPGQVRFLCASANERSLV